MKVKLAGFNVDVENIKFLNGILEIFPDISKDDLEQLKKMHWTPETISASYARISRDPRTIEELRAEARIEIEKSRKSNQSIIYDMGHSSIAEHGVFNIDIVGISRMLSEEIEKSRLVSFTEKSQRYIKIGEDILLPEEFKKDPGVLKKYNELCKDLFDTYGLILAKLEKYFTEKYPVENVKSSKYRDVVNLAKEDARYILPLSTLTQLGMTINSRSLEGILRKLSAMGYDEAETLSKAIYEEIKEYAPSLVKYTTPSEFLAKTGTELKALVEEDALIGTSTSYNTDDVVLCGFDTELENKIIAGILLKSSAVDYQTALLTAKKMPPEKKMRLFKCSVKYLKSYESLSREFEIPQFEFGIRITATAFAQLKRHRMLSLIDGAYSPDNGYVVPPSIIDIGMKNLFDEKIERINSLYREAKEKFGKTADYLLSNSHRKNIFIKCSFRELVHITRLRSDSHAQWDIRNISDTMISLVQEKFPLISNLLCGKEEFTEKMKYFS